MTRTLVQLGFLSIIVAGVFFLGGHAERWCPFGGVEALYTYVTAGNFTCSLGVSNFYIMGALLLSALLFKRVFCGYACPVGALSEWARMGAARLRLKPLNVPRRLDGVLSLLKYPVLAVILYFTYKTGELIFRGFDPCYALISRHGKDITAWAYVASAAILAGSVFVTVPFCRWLCPLAAVLNPFSRLGLAAVHRKVSACNDCGLCTRVCPMAIPVDEVETVRHARCTFCLDCVAVCPKKEKGTMGWTVLGWPSGGVRTRWAIVGLLVLVLGGAVYASHLFPLPSYKWSRGEEPAVTETLDLKIEGLTCRGTSGQLVAFLERDDELEVLGYLKFEAWPGPGFAEARLVFDPSKTDEASIKAAITETYLDPSLGTWITSPFTIKGYAAY